MKHRDAKCKVTAQQVPYTAESKVKDGIHTIDLEAHFKRPHINTQTTTVSILSTTGDCTSHADMHTPNKTS